MKRKTQFMNHSHECEHNELTYKQSKVPEWIRKLNPKICCLQDMYLKYKNVHRARMRCL